MTSPADFAEHYGAGRFTRTRHQTLASDAIADAVFANQLSILLIEMPPQHGKSAIVSQWAPSWFVSLFPERSVGLASYEAGVAIRWGRWVRDTVTELGTTPIKQDSQAADEWMTEAGGGMKSVGVGGPLTSHSIHLGIVDDPIKNAEEADSEVMREKVWNWFLTVMWTRKQPGTVFVVMHTRWHEDDLVGRILAHPEMRKLTKRVTLPALAENDDALGRKPGEALWPERYPADASPDGLLTTRAILPARWWNALYQQRPSSAEGTEIKRAWWQFYDELPVSWEALDYRLASWDATFTDAEKSDYVVGQVWGVFGGYRYLLDKIRARMTFVETCEAVATLHARWKCHGSAVELAANGQAIVNSLQAHIPGVYGVKVGNNGKVARARAVTPQIEGGQVWLPRGASISSELIEECAAFPFGKNDDDVDAMSQALSELAHHMSVPVSHLTPSDNRFVPPHVLELQKRGLLGGLGTAPANLRKL